MQNCSGGRRDKSDSKVFLPKLKSLFKYCLEYFKYFLEEFCLRRVSHKLDNLGRRDKNQEELD